MPVILVIYDAQNNIAYWLDVQAFLTTEEGQMAAGQSSISVHVHKTNVVNEDAIERFRQMKNERIRYFRGRQDADDENVS
jgi:hypothetical protein